MVAAIVGNSQVLRRLIKTNLGGVNQTTQLAVAEWPPSA